MGRGARLITPLLAVSLALSFAGCNGPARAGLLPARVALVLEDAQSGAPLSLLVELRRNARAQLDVRVSDRAVLYDGSSLLRFQRDARGWTREGGQAHPPLRLTLDGAAPLVSLGPQAAWFRAADGTLRRCAHAASGCEAAAEGPPALPDAIPGPGPGFRVWIDGEAVRVALPQAPEGALVWTGARALLGVSWVRVGSRSLEPVVNRVFRGHAALSAAPGADAVVLDGAPKEWDDATPLVVDAPWQLQAGADTHDGARDASFSVAAVWDADRVCLAGRVRDDTSDARDRIELRVGALSAAVPLVPDTGPPAADGARVRAALDGATFEWCSRLSLHAGAQLPLTVALVDHDGDDAPSRIASAPDTDSRGVLVLSREAPAEAPRSP